MGGRSRLAISVVSPAGPLPPGVEQARARSVFPVALVSMPFGPQVMPSIQIGLLASIARTAGFPVEPMHLGLDFAALIDPYRYDQIAGQGTELGNWLFSTAAFGAEAPDPDGRRLVEVAGPYLGALGTEDEAHDWLQPVRRAAASFLDELVDQVDWSGFAAVAFSVTYQQKTASFALAERIKRRWPDVQTIFGGAHFDAPMGEAWMEAVPSIDFGVNGEADLAFPALLAALAEGHDPLRVPGVLGRDERGGVLSGPPAEPVEALDWLPVPDYTDFFDRAERLGLLGPGQVRDVQLPFQAVRGCWWGEKNHCTFCGIRDDLLRYRRKSAPVVERELVAQVRRYGTFSFLNTDLILDLDHLEELLGGLARQGTDLSFWWEVKASLTRDQVRTLRAGGIHTVQPGIESLNSHSLRLMRKGTRAVVNVNLMRWCAYYGIDVKWNRIYGFPGETAETIHAEADLLESLHHLTPPGNMGGISIDRFSPLFEDTAMFPRASIRPSSSYAAVYPDRVDFERAAFSFEADLDGVLAAEAYEPLIDSVRRWDEAVSARPSPTLVAASAPGVVHVRDRRWRHRWRTHVFHGEAAAVYQACFEQPRSVRQIVDELRSETGAADAPSGGPLLETVEEALEHFVAERLVMRDGNLHLALALPATPNR